MNNVFVSNQALFSYDFLMTNRIKELRKARKLTQTQLADLCNTSLRMIQFLEKGERQLTQKWAEDLGTALGVQAWEIMAPSSVDMNDAKKHKWLIERYSAAPRRKRDEVDQILGSVKAK